MIFPTVAVTRPFPPQPASFCWAHRTRKGALLRPLSAQTPDMSARMTPLAGMLEDHFFRAVFIESIATASTMMPPLMMYCQYGFTPMYDRP